VDYRELMKKVEQVVTAIERADEAGATVRTVIESVITQFRGELGIYGGRLYRRRGEDYVLEGIFGAAKQAPEGLRIPADYPPIQAVLETGLASMSADEPGADPDLEHQLGAQLFAAVEVGRGEFILAFDVTSGYPREDLFFSLGILRHSLNQKIRQERMEGIFEEARRIQASIQPRRQPEFEDFDIWGHTDSMEGVGGDFYDFIAITDKILGLAVADVSGHGLPAALQVRDIYMGLRMGLARDLKIVRTVERLNGIIHHSTLTSRFVSLCYGELERDGTFIYVNAGHPPPYHLSAAGGSAAHPLRKGGTVLGPLEEATYDRGFVTLARGDLLVLYTDGITEAHGWGEGDELEEYGVERLLEVAAQNRGRSARDIVEAIFEDVRRFRANPSPEDDQTVVVIRRPAASTPAG
jgi:sigma-B regulation protein RsbU (phosphoserine phosphatase)